MVQDLLDHFVPALQGFRPLQRLATEETSIASAQEPHTQTRRADLVWELARGPERRLLLLEHQARVDPDMGTRMAQYLVNIWQSATTDAELRPERPIYPLVFSTAAQPFGTWLQPQPHAAGDGSVIFTPGPLIDIHAYPLLSRDVAAFSLPRDSLVASVIALARLQWALRQDWTEGGGRAVHFGMIVHVTVDWLKALLPAGGSRLGDGFAVWMATGMADFLRSWPDSRAAIDNISTLTFDRLENAMVTVQDLIQEERQEGRQEGQREGRQEGRQEGQREGQREGRLATLADYVQLQWGTEAAAAFRAKLADPAVALPTLAGLQARLERQEPPLPGESTDSGCKTENSPGRG